MPGEPATELEIAERRELVAAARVRGMTISALVKQFGVPRKCIQDDIEAVKKASLDRAADTLDRWKAKQLEELRQVKLAAWRAWDATRREMPDAKFLSRIIDCVKEEAKIRGTYEPFTARLIDNEGNDIFYKALAKMGVDELKVLDAFYSVVEEEKNAVRDAAREAKQIVHDVESTMIEPLPNGKPSKNGNGKPRADDPESAD